MKALLLVLLLAVTVAATPGADADAPLRYADLAKAGFRKVEWKRLTPGEVAEFYRAYPADREMLDRVRLGDEDTAALEECIAGEAPPVAEALEKFPLYYPMLGRMKDVTGTFEWQGKNLLFRTDRQLYRTDEAHIHLRLKQLGFTRGSAPRRASVEAVWCVTGTRERKPPAPGDPAAEAFWTTNLTDGLRILYLQKIDLH